jgi:hypothetical protein
MYTEYLKENREACDMRRDYDRIEKNGGDFVKRRPTDTVSFIEK